MLSFHITFPETTNFKHKIVSEAISNSYTDLEFDIDKAFIDDDFWYSNFDSKYLSK